MQIWRIVHFPQNLTLIRLTVSEKISFVEDVLWHLKFNKQDILQ